MILVESLLDNQFDAVAHGTTRSQETLCDMMRVSCFRISCLIASSAECALLIPPSITFVVYSWLTGTSIAALFAAGLVVGVVLGLAFMLLVAGETNAAGLKGGDKSSAPRRWRALREASWAIGMQVIILGGIFAGFFTATEAAAVSVAYAILVEVLVLRALGWRQVFDIAKDSAISTSAVFILLGYARCGRVG